MKHIGTFIVGAITVLVLLFWMITYQVSFHEAAVVTTFGKATGDGAVLRGDSAEAAGVIGNLRFKWPYPIQRVYSYDTRVHVIEDRLEDQQTKDKQMVAAHTAVAWRVADPLAFQTQLGTVENAQSQIRTRMRDLKSVLGDFDFDQLTNTSPVRVKLAEAEQRMMDKLQKGFSEPTDMGIKIERVGITRIVLPGPVTAKVFERMRADRERLAGVAIDEGNAAADTIKGEAAKQKEQILSFARLRADKLRAEGDQAALGFSKRFAENEDFAIFLRKLDTYREALKNNTTFVFDWQMFPEFRNAPSVTPPARLPDGGK